MSALPADRCEALTTRGAPGERHRCNRAARHDFHLAGNSGRTIRVCDVHRRMLQRRRRSGSDEELLADWGHVVPGPDSSSGVAGAFPRPEAPDPRPDAPLEGDPAVPPILRSSPPLDEPL